LNGSPTTTEEEINLIKKFLWTLILINRKHEGLIDFQGRKEFTKKIECKCDK
jgi:hypothetical protein